MIVLDWLYTVVQMNSFVKGIFTSKSVALCGVTCSLNHFLCYEYKLVQISNSNSVIYNILKNIMARLISSWTTLLCENRFIWKVLEGILKVNHTVGCLVGSMIL
jgi:hypothetical protein